jgi:hypothetical protein
MRLIPTLLCPEVRVYPILLFVFSSGQEIYDCWYLCIGPYVEWFVPFPLLDCRFLVVLMMSNLVCTSFRLRSHSKCEWSSEDAYSSLAPDPTFDLVGGPSCPKVYGVGGLWFTFIRFSTLPVDTRRPWSKFHLFRSIFFLFQFCFVDHP